MIKVNKSTIYLNSETQFDKNGRPFRLSGIKADGYNTIHRFRYLDVKNEFFNIEVNMYGEFIRMSFKPFSD